MIFLSVRTLGQNCGNLNNPDQDSDSSFSNESEPDLSESSNSLPNLSGRFSKQPQSQNKLETTKAAQQKNNTDSTLSASNNQEENKQSSDVTPGTAQNELSSMDVYDNTGSSSPGNNSSVILTAPDGTKCFR